MSRLVEAEKWENHKELIFPCDCGGGDYLRITWDDMDPEWRYLWVEHNQSPRGFGRLKAAWAGLMGKVHHGDIILSDGSIKGLSEFLNELK